MKTTERGLNSIRIINGIINFLVLAAVMLLLGISLYALWDSRQIYLAAGSFQYAVYKPSQSDEGKSFRQLQMINSEVFAWLTVYDTNIDYPVTQARDNMKYINTSAEGRYSLSGAIFLDSSNSKDFTDFNSIIYGHHMARKTMFGEIGRFADKQMFDTHEYGNLHINGKDHGIEFFAFVHTDAYNGKIFTPNVLGENLRQTYLDNLLEEAMYTRDIGVTIQDKIVLLATCSSSSTNGRDILVGRLTDVPLAGPHEIGGQPHICVDHEHYGPAFILWLILHIIIIALLAALIFIMLKKKQKEENALEAWAESDE